MSRIRNLGWIFTMAADTTTLLLLNKNILVWNFDGTLKLNLLEPPDTLKPSEWAVIFCDIFIQAFSLYDGTKNFMLEHLQNLYVKFEGTGYYPSIFDLYYYIKAMKFPNGSRTAHYRESFLNRTGGLISGHLGSAFDCSRGHIKDVFERNCIFFIHNLYLQAQVLVVNLMLSWLYFQKSNWVINPPETEHYIGLEDALLLFDSSFEKRPDLGMPILHYLLATIRKAGITVIVAAQTPSSLGSSIFSHAGLTVTLSLSDGKDVERMIQMMGIKDAAMKNYCYRIPKRQAVVKMARYPEPFVLIIPEMKDGQ